MLHGAQERIVEPGIAARCQPIDRLSDPRAIGGQRLAELNLVGKAQKRDLVGRLTTIAAAAEGYAHVRKTELPQIRHVGHLGHLLRSR